MKKRYLKIKKAVLLMALCFILTPSLIAQTTSVDSLRMQYDSLDAKYFPSGILYNRSPHFLYCFKYDSTFQWLSNPDFSANPYKYDVGYHDYKKSIFDMMYEDMLYSSNNDTILIQRSLYNTNDSIAKSAYDFPISLMQINFNTLRLDALKEQHIHFDTLNNVYTIMPDTFYVNDSIYTLIQNPDSLAYLAFDNDDVYAATSTRSVIYKEFIKTHLDTIWKFGIDITYQLPLGLFVHNDGQAIPTVQIDFDDGNGFVNVNWNSSKTINYSDTILDNGHGVPVHYGFCKAYPKVLRVKFPSLQNDLIMSFPVKIVGMDHLSDTIIKTSTLPFLCSINEPNYTPSEEKVSIRYADKQVHELSKPIIVVEGFESALNDYGIISYEGLASGYIYDDDGNRAYDWLEEMKILFDSLHVLGYDIIYIDPKDPRTWIQRNGLSTIKVIQWANSRLDTNLSNEKLVVMGASMGGLIVRYSLRKMELAGCCHNTRLYVTFDTPHQKANIPVGDQHFVKDVGKAFKFITTSAYDSYHGALNSPAARQMLAYHIESTAVTDRDNWQAVLDSLGHPQNCRRIALISGSENGTAHSLNSPNSELLRMQIPFILPYEYKGWIPPPVHNWILMPKVTNLINFRAFSESQDTVYYGNEPSETLKNITFSLLTYGVTGTALTFADALSVNPAWTLPMQAFKIGAEYGAEHLYDKFYNRSMELNVYPNTSYPLVYTTAPGGLSDTQKSIEDVGYGLINAKTPNHTFIPSVSALDLNTSSLYMDIKSSYLADQSITSFDCYWATQRSDASPKENMMHVEVNSDNRAWIQDQILNDWELRAPNGEYKGGKLKLISYNQHLFTYSLFFHIQHILLSA